MILTRNTCNSNYQEQNVIFKVFFWNSTALYLNFICSISRMNIFSDYDLKILPLCRTYWNKKKAEHISIILQTMWNVVPWESRKLPMRMFEMSLWFSVDQSAGGSTKGLLEALCLYSCFFQDGIDWSGN